MILPLALIVAAATPTDTLARGMEEYTFCLREKAGAGTTDRDAAAERARFAMSQCSDQREATVQLAIQLLSPQFSAENVHERIEWALAGVEAIFPAFLMAGGDVDIPTAIAPAVRRYSTCLRVEMEERGATANFNPATYRQAAESSLAACSTVRAETIGESEALISSDPDYHDANRRRDAVQHAFDGTDSLHRNFVEIMDFVRREIETNASN